ncbi:MAG: hypothetical protein IJZ07_09285 [Clostridia bacterium]|nr:hypothetical protein [Clostridia bacterium]
MHNSKYKCTYLLRQQTPLIHFQYRQPHAALRASEVKPMLDRFMQNFIKKHNLKIPKDWYIDIPEGNSFAKPFNYKMSIKTDAEPETVQSNNLYFGKMGHKVSPAEALIFKCKNSDGTIINGVKLEILCFLETKAEISESLKGCGLADKFSLNELIGFILPAFFALTCFGTRATKGFGSFNVDGEKLSEAYIHLFVPVFYKIPYMAVQGHKEIMDDIWVISGLMKSGFNFGKGSYYKGRALIYLRETQNKKIGADKAFIKKKVLTNGEDRNRNSEDCYEYDEFRFVRAMLGLPQDYTYRKSVNTTREGKVSISPAKGNSVERFASPVRFVPNGKELYIVPDEIPAEMFNAEFKFKSERASSEIKTPSDSEFNLIEYLDWFMNAFNTKTNLKNGEFTENDRMRISKTVTRTIAKNLTIRKCSGKAGDSNA